jgi:hypothetical protein
MSPHSSSRGPASPFACESNPEALQNDLNWAHERAVPLVADDASDRPAGVRVEDARTRIAAGGKDTSRAVFAYIAIGYGIHRAQLQYPNQHDIDIKGLFEWLW